MDKVPESAGASAPAGMQAPQENITPQGAEASVETSPSLETMDTGTPGNNEEVFENASHELWSAMQATDPDTMANDRSTLEDSIGLSSDEIGAARTESGIDAELADIAHQGEMLGDQAYAEEAKHAYDSFSPEEKARMAENAVSFANGDTEENFYRASSYALLGIISQEMFVTMMTQKQEKMTKKSIWTFLRILGAALLGTVIAQNPAMKQKMMEVYISARQTGNTALLKIFEEKMPDDIKQEAQATYAEAAPSSPDRAPFPEQYGKTATQDLPPQGPERAPVTNTLGSTASSK